MEFIKRVLHFLIEPFKKFGSLGISEKITRYLTKHKFLIYILAFITTSILIYFVYFYN